MDSFTGDFIGGVSNDELIDEMNWRDEQKIESALEFGFDSFGPESILFPQTTNGDNLMVNQMKKLETIKESNEKSSETFVKGSTDEDNEITVDKVRESISSLSELSDHLIANNSDYEDLVSLSVAEPQLKQKLDTCFDSDRIRNGYEIHAEPKSILAFDKDYRQSDRSLEQNSDKCEDDHQNNHEISQNSNLERFVDAEPPALNETLDSFMDNEYHSIINNSFKDQNTEEDKEQVDKSIENKDGGQLTGEKENENNESTNEPINELNGIESNDESTKNLSNTSDSITITNLSVENDKKTLTEEDIKNTSSEGDAFKRQTTLTKSQRKRLSPKYKFEEVPSTLDDPTLVSTNVDILDEITKQQDQQSSQDQFKSVPLNDNHLSNPIYPNVDKNQPEGIK